MLNNCRSLQLSLLAVGCVLFSAANLYGQGQGSISGLVTDKSGSVMPTAQIKLTNLATGLTRSSTANDSGNYTIPAVPIGTYSLEVSAAGFSTYKQTNIQLNVNDNLRIDASLDLSSVNETIEVRAETVQIRAEDATVGQVVNSQQVEALSVNGRNFTSLAALVPGASSTQPSLNTPVGVTSNTSISFNGLRVSNNVWRMDGQENYDRGCGGCVVVLPSVESINEFKVETANSAVDTGFGNAGQVNVSTKSGTRQFHGTGWEFVRNDKMDAKNYFTNLNGQPKPPLRFNVFGYNIGGPVFIPKLYPKSKTRTFFFFNEEWRKLRQSSIFNAPAPSLASRTGDFTGYAPIRNPDSNNAPFPNNIIPASQIDANALILARPNFIFPVPTNGRNFAASASAPTDLREEVVRLDHSFTDREQVFFRYVQESNKQNFTNNLWSGSSYPTTTTLLNNNPKLYMGQITSVLKPTVVNTASVGYTSQPLDLSLNGNYQRPAGLNIPELYTENRLNRIPNIQLNGSVFGTNYDLASWPWSNALQTWAFQDNLSITRGKHQLTIGGIVMLFDKQQDLFGQTQGNFQFNGSVTGNEFADFLLGRAFRYDELRTQTKPNYQSRSYGVYGNDAWKISSKLTMTLGLRWDGFPHAYEENNQVASFYVKLYNPAQAPAITSNGRISPANPGNPLNGIGIAGQNGIPRGLVDNHWAIFEPRFGIAWRPFENETVIRAGYGVYYERVQGNDIYNVGPNPPFSRTDTIFNTSLSKPGGGTQEIVPPALTVYDPAYPTAQVMQYNFGVQKRVAKGVIADLSYVGTKGTHLSDARNINQPTPAGAAQVLAGANVNQFRPYPGYAAITQYFNGGTSNYNSLQASLRSQEWHGLTLQASYTYSHAIDLVSGDVPGSNAHQDAYRTYLEKASSNFDRRQILVLSYVYGIPMPVQNRFVRFALGGWQLSGISAFQAGIPLNVTLPGDNAGIGGGAFYRPDLVGDWSLNGGSRTQFFNPLAFAAPARGQFGNAGRNLVRQAGINNTDASLFKNFPSILGVESSGLQFRAEFYNIFNHTNFNSYGTGFGNANFGQAIGARDARSIQLGLRLYF